MKYTYYVVCSTRGCHELIPEPKRYRGQKLTCPKCEKKKQKENNVER